MTAETAEIKHLLPLQDWLARMGFSANPFASRTAEKEDLGLLVDCFVDRPFLEPIIGDASAPQTAFLLAGRGAGKTATREIIAHLCVTQGSFLPVRYYDFAPALDGAGGDPARVTLGQHVERIVRYTLSALESHAPAGYFNLLSAEDRGLFRSYVDAYANEVVKARLAARVPGPGLAIDLRSLSPRDLLANLVDILVRPGLNGAASFRAVSVLVDPEDPLTVSAELLSPLVTQPALLRLPHLALKFFLQPEIGRPLLAQIAVPTSEITVSTAEWDGEALKKVINNRLGRTSGGQYRNLEELCRSDAKAMAFPTLLETCQQSPRILLELADRVLAAQALQAQTAGGNDSSLIGKDTITAVCEAYRVALTLPPTVVIRVGAKIEAKPIFISYRRDNSEAITFRIHEFLNGCFPEQVFLDQYDLEAGRWNDQLAAALAGCKVLLAVIGDEWLKIADDKCGRRRLDDPDDVLRREIAHALAHKIVVIPVVTDGTKIPDKDCLPDDIKDLFRYQVQLISNRRFTLDTEELVEKISAVLEGYVKSAGGS